MDRLRHIMVQLSKVAVAAATIVGIAGAILTLTPREELADGVGVPNSRADVLWLSSSEPTHTQRFARSLEQLGHGDPRVFDFNGNEVYVSDRTTRKRPTEVLRRYQRQLVAQGANERAHLTGMRQVRREADDPAGKKRLTAMSDAVMNGDVVPQVVDEDKVTMFGLLRTSEVDSASRGDLVDRMARMTQRMERPLDRLPGVYRRCGGDPDLVDKARRKREETDGDCQGPSPVCSEQAERLRRTRRTLAVYAEAIARQPELEECRALGRWMNGRYRRRVDGFAGKVDAFRSIQAVRPEGAATTHVTAVWSGRGFEMDAILRGERTDDRSGGSRAEQFPLCDGCERGWSFGGYGSEKAFANHVVWSDRSVASVASQYLRTMHREGWQRRGTSSAMNHIRRTLQMPTSSTQWLRFSRGNRHMTLRIRRDSERGRTEITAMRSD